MVVIVEQLGTFFIHRNFLKLTIYFFLFLNLAFRHLTENYYAYMQSQGTCGINNIQKSRSFPCFKDIHIPDD